MSTSATTIILGPSFPDEVPDEEEENDLEDDYYGYVCYPVYGYTPGDPGDRYWVK